MSEIAAMSASIVSSNAEDAQASSPSSLTAFKPSHSPMDDEDEDFYTGNGANTQQQVTNGQEATDGQAVVKEEPAEELEEGEEDEEEEESDSVGALRASLARL